MLTKCCCLSSIPAHYLFSIQCCVPVRCCALSKLADLHRPHTRLSSRHTGCVFRSKIPSVRLPSVCKYTYRLMTIAHSLCTRGLITLPPCLCHSAPYRQKAQLCKINTFFQPFFPTASTCLTLVSAPSLNYFIRGKKHSRNK